MKLIRPTAVSDTNLVSSTVPETDHAAWSSGTTYALAARVIKAHRIWESTQASNTNHDPQTAGISWWVDMGPTNRWGMFDTVVGTETTATGSITLVLEPGRIDALALLQLDAATVTVNMTLAGDTVFWRGHHHDHDQPPDRRCCLRALCRWPAIRSWRHHAAPLARHQRLLEKSH
jgi:hypothetical protein